MAFGSFEFRLGVGFSGLEFEGFGFIYGLGYRVQAFGFRVKGFRV